MTSKNIILWCFWYSYWYWFRFGVRVLEQWFMWRMSGSFIHFLDLTRNPKLSLCPFLLDHPSHAPQNYPKGGSRKWSGWQDDRRFLGEVSQSLGNFRQRHTNQNQVLCEMPQQSDINTLIAMVNHYCIDLIVFRNSFFIVMARKPLWTYILQLIFKYLTK